MPVAVVTDSTSSLPEGVAAQRGIRVVPLEVRLGARVGQEGVDIDTAQLCAALADRRLDVQTSRPAPAAVRGLLPRRAGRGRVGGRLGAPVAGAVGHLGRGAAGGGGGRRRPGPGGRLACGVHGAGLRGARRRRRRRRGRADRRGRGRGDRTSPTRCRMFFSRRHPRTAAPRRSDRRGRGLVGHGARGQAVAARRAGPHPAAGEGAHHRAGRAAARRARRAGRGGGAGRPRRAAPRRRRPRRGAGRAAARAPRRRAAAGLRGGGGDRRARRHRAARGRGGAEDGGRPRRPPGR